MTEIWTKSRARFGLKPLAALLVTLLGIQVAIAQTAETKLQDAVVLAPGRWVWEPQLEENQNACAEAPTVISIDAENNRYEARYPVSNPEAVDAATITTTGRLGDLPFLVLNYDDEDRLDDNGELQVWVMVFLSSDRFVWVRRDWFTEDGVKGTTAPLVRCPAS